MRRGNRRRAFFVLAVAVAFAMTIVLFSFKGRGAAGDGDAGAPAVKPAARAGKRGAAAAAKPGETGAPPAAKPAASVSARAAPAAPPALPASAPEDTPATSLPTEKGLPVLVDVAVYFVDLKSFDDNKGEFECTVDLRLRWTDLRVRFPANEAVRGYQDFRGKEAEERLAKMWAPEIEVTNRLEGSSVVGRRLRIFAEGRVETMTRTTARYKVNIDAERFPFDHQELALELLVRETTTDEVVLRFRKDDVEFSRVAPGARLETWKDRFVELRAEPIPGWEGDAYSHVRASLFVDRMATTSLAPIFIPLVASLLIPLLAIWMNRATEDGFEIEAFELANMGIGGLFSVIALSFAIYSAFGVVSGSDNTVTRLFALNYVSLAIALTVVVVSYRYNVLHAWFGRYVHEEAFRFVMWAFPLVSLAAGVAFILVAAS